MSKRFYINDFCEDLNYRNVILYIGKVDVGKLLYALQLSMVNKLYRLDYALFVHDIAKRNFIYIENCDLQNLDWPIHEYLDAGYNVYILREDGDRYYIDVDMP